MQGIRVCRGSQRRSAQEGWRHEQVSVAVDDSRLFTGHRTCGPKLVAFVPCASKQPRAHPNGCGGLHESPVERDYPHAVVGGYRKVQSVSRSNTAAVLINEPGSRLEVCSLDPPYDESVPHERREFHQA